MKELAYTESHPQALAASAPEGFAAFRGGSGQRRWLSAFDLKEHHECRESEYRHEEEKIIAHDRAVIAISRLEEGGTTPFSESSCSPEIISCAATKNQNHGRHPEEFLQIDAHTSFDEHHAERDGDNHA